MNIASMNARLNPVLTVVIVAAVLGAVVAHLLSRRSPSPPATEVLTILTPAKPLAPFTLLSADAGVVDSASLRGHWTLVFFGFTHCPDVCPTTLTLLAGTVRSLADLPAAARPRVLLISVDPERDDPRRLADYVRFFDPAFIGATAQEPELSRAAAAFATPYARVPLAAGGYTMDHGPGIFIVNPSGAIAAYTSAPGDSARLARDYRQLMTYAGSP